MSFHHTSDLPCTLCDFKLTQADPRLGVWFKELKARYPNVHISWSYRGAEEQELAFQEGKSELHYPASAHNKVNANAQPCARALDLFQIDEDGVARFAPLFYAKIADECEQNRDPIKWGGNWKSLGDKDHFELSIPG